jgi:GR25 family glycosyltransferase involved in LPS biosynthesis
MTNNASSRLLIQVINLARRTDRLSKIGAELQRAGLSFEVQRAVDGQLNTIGSEFLSNGEIGCWKSHVNSMRKQVEDQYSFSLILEDDATISPKVDEHFLTTMMDLMERNKLDMLQIGFIEQFYSVSLRPGILEFLIALLKGRGVRDSSGFRFVPGEFRAGAHAYIVGNRLAKAISETVPEPPLIPWDGFLESLASGQVGRGDIKIARLVKSLVAQSSRAHEGSRIDSDIAS